MTEHLASESKFVEVPARAKHHLKRPRVMAEALEETHVEARDLEALDKVVAEANGIIADDFGTVSGDEDCEPFRFKVYAVEVTTTTYYIVRNDVVVDANTVDYTMVDNKPKLYYTTRAGRKAALHLLEHCSRPVLGEMELVHPAEAGLTVREYNQYNALMETMPPGKLAPRLLKH